MILEKLKCWKGETLALFLARLQRCSTAGREKSNPPSVAAATP